MSYKFLDDFNSPLDNLLDELKKFNKITPEENNQSRISLQYLKKSIDDFSNKVNSIDKKFTSRQIKNLVDNSEYRIQSNYDFALGEAGRLSNILKSPNTG